METPPTPTIPAINGRRFLGLLPAFQQNPRHTMIEVWRVCGDLGRFRLGPLPVVQVNTPILAGEVLRDEASFRRGYLVEQALISLIGDVLTTHDLEEHDRRRKAMLPEFSPTRLAEQLPTIGALVEQHLRAWQDGQQLDLGQQLMQMSLMIAARVFLSEDWRKEAPRLVSLFDAFEAYLTPTLKRLVRFPLCFPLPPYHRPASAARKAIGQRLQVLIRQRRSGATSGDDLLSALLKTHLSDRQIEAELLNILFNVFPLTASTLLTLHYLLLDLPAYAVVEAEADAVLGSGPLTHMQVKALQYALQAYEETERLCPFVPAVMRQAHRTVTLSSGHCIQKGTLVLVAIAAIQRRPDLYPHPDVFELDRLTGARKKQLPRDALLMFGSGSHTCLGNRYSLMLGPVLLALLLRQFRFTYEGAPFQPDALSSVLQRVPFQVVVQRRNTRPTDDLVPASARAECA
jgi:cytochrome P450